MPRAAQRSPSTDAVFRDETACVETVELLDRTGIIAASLPKRRRSPENVPPPLPARTPVCEPVVDQDLRPKAVVIHRRARSWLVGGAGVALLAIGWLAGTFTLPAPVDDALPAQPSPAVATQQAAPQAPAVPPAPQAAPVTVFVPVTVKQPAPAPKKKAAKERVVALPPAQTRPPEQPRSDLGLTTRPPEAIAEDFEDMMNSSMAGSMAMQMAQGMVVYSSGR
ncbi:hypothetical protein [Amycolatopsis sp. lyj-112]|uniref:hypothetical protein n=1 Tax=Amycolatopsis sp. lyj-112 TaxID=2789288 RepID=UPI00397A7F7C